MPSWIRIRNTVIFGQSPAAVSEAVVNKSDVLGQASMRASKVQEKPPALQRENFLLFFLFVGHFCILGSLSTNPQLNPDSEILFLWQSPTAVPEAVVKKSDVLGSQAP